MRKYKRYQSYMMVAMLLVPMYCFSQVKPVNACADGYLFTNPDELKEADPNDTTVNWAEGFRIIEPETIGYDVNWAEGFRIIEPETIGYDVKTSRRPRAIERSWAIVRERNQTVLYCYFVVPFDATKEIWLGGDEAYIIDAKTGTKYKARGTDDPKMWGKTFGIKAPAGSWVEFCVHFPPIPQNVKDVYIYGVQKWGFRGNRNILIGVPNQYDKKIPKFHIPQLIELEKPNYDPDDMGTYAVYNNAHLVQPMKEKTMAIWLTPEATYLAITAVQDWNREYFGFHPDIVLISETNSATKYKLRKVLGLPTDHQFFIEGLVGDHQAFILEFDPLPLDVTTITYYEPEGQPFQAWGAQWNETLIQHLRISDLKANQKLFKYYKRKIKK